MPDQSQTAIAIQCHKCQKKLRYSGRKPYVTCPGCGESVPVPDNIQEGDVHEVLDKPPVQTTAVPSTPVQPPATQSTQVQPELPTSPISSSARTSAQSFSRTCNRTVIAGIVLSILGLAFHFFWCVWAEQDRDGFRLQGSSASSMLTLIGMTGVQIAVMIRQTLYNQTEYRSVMKCVGIAQILIGISFVPLLLCGVCAMFLLPPKVLR
jgi:hypothetical protein